MNCKHCFCIPFEHSVLGQTIAKDIQCCKCGKAMKYSKKDIKEIIKKQSGGKPK